MSRELKSFLIRALLFLLLGPYLFLVIALVLLIPVSIIDKLYCNDWWCGFGMVIDALSFLILPSYYLTIKVCGLFSSLDRLRNNAFLKLCIVLILNFFLILVLLAAQYFELSVNEKTGFFDYVLKYSFSFDMIYIDIFLFFGLFLSYLLYRFFAFLTKRFPVPFEKIGYYSSREFYISLLRK